MRQRIWIKALGILLCGSIFIVIALSLNNPQLNAADEAITHALEGARIPWLTTVMWAITTMCAPLWLLMICLVLMFIFRKRNFSIPIAVNLMVSVTLNEALKNLFLRERPPALHHAVTVTGYSFPSGHAMAAAAFYGFLIYMVSKSGMTKQHKRWLQGLLSLLILGIGFSRVYLGVHYASDVLAGFAVSIAYLIIFATGVGYYLRAGNGDAVSVYSRKNKRVVDSFLHAFDGIMGGISGERNMIIHFAMMALVTVFGLILQISQGEWLICIVFFGLVIGMELMNTAVETVVDICMPQPDPRAKLAKDTAAGAVMMVSLAAAVAGAIIFIPKLLPTFW